MKENIFTAIKSIMLPLANKHDKASLRSFALTMSLAFPAVFMGLLPWFFTLGIPWWPLVISAFLMSLYVVLPKALYYPYLAWMVFASILGWLNTKLILAIAYIVLIVPTGLIMQGLKKLQYRVPNEQESAWVEREKQISKDSLKEPF